MILFIKHIDIEGPGTLGEFFAQTAWTVKTVNLHKGEELPPLHLCEAIVSLGGPMNVYETEINSFLEVEESFLKNALKENIPVLGICLGSQLMVKISGGLVEKSLNPEIGWYPIELTKEGREDLLFVGVDDLFDMFLWHEDKFNIPQKTLHLSKSLLCPNQALKIGKYAWGLQFHPEITYEMLLSWLDFYRIDLDDMTKKNILLGYFEKRVKYDYFAKKIYYNFACAIDQRSKF